MLEVEQLRRGDAGGDSLLNSYAGLAAATAGFALSNTVLIVCGALDRASGFFLSLVLSRAMDRSFIANETLAASLKGLKEY